MAKRARYIEIVEEASYPNDRDGSYRPAPQGSGAYILPTSVGLDAPGESEIEDPSVLDRSAEDTEPGFYSPAGPFEYPINIQSVIYNLKAILGGYAFTAGADDGTGTVQPNIHEFWRTNDDQLPSFLIRVGKDDFEHCFQGCRAESGELTTEDALTNLSTEWAGQKDFVAPEGIQPVSSVKGKVPKARKIPFHQVCLKIDGVDNSPWARSLTTTFGNNTDAEAGRHLCSRHPDDIPANAAEASLSTELDKNFLENLEKLWGSATGPSESGAQIVTAEATYGGGNDANGNEQKMIVSYGRAKFQTVETQPSGREQLTQPITIRAFRATQTLDDGTTEVETDVYVKVICSAPEIVPGGNPPA